MYRMKVQLATNLLQEEESKELSLGIKKQTSQLLYVSPEQYFKTLNTGEWVKNVSLGQVFTPRTGHECILADGMIYLFGGTDDEERLNDIFAYNIRANSWDKISCA